MSLINDALKRAKEAQRKETPSGGSPMRPVEAKPTERDFGLVLPVVIVLLVVTAIVFIGLAMTRQPATSTVKNIAAAPAIVPPQAPTQTVAIAVVPATNPPPAALPVPAPATSAPPAEVISPAPIKAEAPKPVRLQGIAYDPLISWAIVNGKTVYVGDFVNGMQVMTISRKSVTLVGNGQTNILVVGQH